MKVEKLYTLISTNKTPQDVWRAYKCSPNPEFDVERLIDTYQEHINKNHYYRTTIALVKVLHVVRLEKVSSVKVLTEGKV